MVIAIKNTFEYWKHQEQGEESRMDDQVKVLAQAPAKLKIADVEVTIYPPTPYRLHALNDLIAKNKVTPGEVDDVAICQLMLREKDIWTAGGLIEGKTPAPFDNANWFRANVTYPEILGILETFVGMLNIGGLLKNVVALKGMV